MKKIELGKSGLMASEISIGCMRMNQIDTAAAANVLRAACDGGIDFFDHADIYGGGECEKAFTKALKHAGLKRSDFILQSKCGIRKGCFDFSKKHILEAADGILERLETDYLDVLVLHRPDALMEPEEVAEAFDALEQRGKVRFFGVSNQNAMQIELLKSCVKQQLIVNQLQFSPAHTGMVDAGILVNTGFDNAVDRDGMLLDYCRLNNITIQAWSPFQYGMIKGTFFSNPDFAALTGAIRALAAKKGVTDSAMTASWILRHPAKMQVIVGTMNPERIAGLCKADASLLSREEWYEIYLAAGNILP